MPAKVAVPLQQGLGVAIGPFDVVANLAKLDDFGMGCLLGDEVAEAHLPLLMAAVGQRACEKGDLTRSPAP